MNKHSLVTQNDIEQFQANGYLIIKNLIPEATINQLTSHCEKLCQQDSEKKIIEKNGDPFSVYIDQDDEHISHFKKIPELLKITESLLNSSVYVHQIKFNHKVAMGGSEIMWHEDFVYWHELDHIPAPKLLTAAILLDEVNDFNSPLLLIPKSHVIQNDNVEKLQKKNQVLSGVEMSWANSEKLGDATLVGDLRYQIDRETLKKLTAKNNICSFTGPVGSVVFFHCKTVHASTKNISPWDRRMLFISYNSVNNACVNYHHSRPPFIAYQNNAPLSTEGYE